MSNRTYSVWGRAINIRKYKNYCFINIHTNRDKIAQLIINKVDFINNHPSIGDVIMAKGTVVKTKTDNHTLKVSSIKMLAINQRNISKYGTVHISNDISQKQQMESLIGGQALKSWHLKNEIIDVIEKKLNRKKFIKIYSSKILGNHRGTYTVDPFVTIQSSDKSNKYLRITLETELKKYVALTLNSVYEIGKVFRNKGKGSDHIQEYLVLELVAPFYHISDLLRLLRAFANIGVKLAKKHNLTYNETIAKSPTVVDYNNLINMSPNREYKSVKKNLQNTIVTNLSEGSPLAKEKDNHFLEFEWVFEGTGLAHGYIDENDANIVLPRFQEQLEQLQKKGICADIDNEFINVISYGLPPTGSVIFGFDRFLMKLLRLQNIEQATMPLGI